MHKSTATDKDFAFNGTFEPEQSYRLQKMHLTQIQEILQWRKENQYQIYELKEIPTLLSEASAVTTLEIGQNSKMFQ